ncbi:aromatic prenyltransferase [Streptomyces litchfieldiae]|uniref:Aromatic prenyltransferase n=1 Tax=Streptomyces litchfieldiae TaxID=3075543 RepID=A0ABU2MZ42_9ACTN|nr:aromatic prenyltransferase [Streptomyces sp. DSM 44938]MDT0346905.1 aromatic prenyltransferase [Streptomyces sp. DSM 44938]
MAGAMSIPFNGEGVRKSLEVFEEEMNRTVVQLKTTTKPGDGLYYRFFCKWDKGLQAIARHKGLIGENDSAFLGRLQPEVLEKFPEATRAGLDFEVGHGLAKVWTFTGVRPIEELFDIPSVPDSVRAHAGFFARHGLRRVFFVASDFQSETMNVYPIVEEECRNEEWLRRLVAESGGSPAGAPDCAVMIDSLATTACLGMTFSWRDPDLHRWALYNLNVTDGGRSEIAPELPSRLDDFHGKAPTLNANPQVNVAWSFGRAGFYTKLEKCYAKDANYFLTARKNIDMTR